MKFWPLFVMCATIGVVGVGASSGIAAPPSVERIEPAVGQQGTEFSLTLTGSGLQAAAEAMLYAPGVKCERLEPVSDTRLILHLRAAADCPTGMHTLRMRSAEGISELFAFRISSLTVVVESEPNDTPETAQSVELNSTLAGTVEAGDIDSFHVSLKKGQRLSAEAEAMRAGGSMLDVVLSVIGPDGEWLIAVDDTALRRQDPFVSLVAPRDGDYIIQIHEASFEGDENSRYALHVGTFPAPEFVFPPGGPAGQTVEVEFRGDAGGPIRQSVAIPNQRRGTISVFAEQDQIRSPAGLPFRVCEFANVVEAEPNDSDQHPIEPVSLPVALNGVLQQNGDVDLFRVRAEADQKIRVDVFAARLGSPVDSLLEVLDHQGRLIAASDDGASHDSQVTVVFPETGIYQIRLTDKRASGSEQHFYRIELSEYQPQLTAFLSRPDRLSQQRQAISVPQGNRVLTHLAVQRRGVPGDVFLSASGLPEGVSLPPVQIPADRFWVPVVMEASAEAPVRGALVDIEVSGLYNNRSVTGGFRQIVDLVASSADQLYQAAETEQLAVAVIEPVPYSVTLRQPATSLSPDGTLDLQIDVIRTAEFRGPLEITFPFLPPWVDGPDRITVPPEDDSVSCTIRAWARAVPRTWPLCVEAKPGLESAESSSAGSATGRGRRSRRPTARTAVASNLIELTIAESPVRGEVGTLVAEQGQPAACDCRLQVTGTIPDSLTAVLEGLPNRVSAAPISFDPSQKTVRFSVIPDGTAPTGSFPDLVVRLDAIVNGEHVSWRIARGSVLKIEPAGMLHRDETGKPLTRLDVLRQKSAAAP